MRARPNLNLKRNYFTSGKTQRCNQSLLWTGLAFNAFSAD
jgi:hypothetical protein